MPSLWGDLITPIRLADHFPQAGLLSQTRYTGVHPLLQEDRPMMVDAATETPLHFVEKRIDPNYEWNEVSCTVLVGI